MHWCALNRIFIEEVELAMSSEVKSVVEYLYEQGGPRPYKCGYCKSPDTSYTQGVWGFKMACQEFQNLVDRGFQRSGNFVYKPVLKQTCCPQYVIRMDTKKFKLSKSQKSCIKKFKRYLLQGLQLPSTPVHESTGETVAAEVSQAAPSNSAIGNPSSSKSTDQLPVADSTSKKTRKPVRPGVGPDPNKPPCKKAKIIRMEKREQKRLAQMQEQGTTAVKPRDDNSTHSSNQVNCDSEFCQCLKDLLTFPKDEECIHKFKTRLVRLDSVEFTASYDESYEVFRKFQTIIHKEKESDADRKQFDEFLVHTPLRYEEGSEKMISGYGTYHQQYLLDGKIFAVGVLDILQKGVVCEYLYYDPDYRFIAPGVITALLEVSLTQEFYQQNPKMQYYYMGFYVQSCPKMNYKSRYSASDLLCPETYTYIPLEKCIPKLKASAYSRLADDDVEDYHECWSEGEISNIPVLADMTAMPYRTYTTLYNDRAKNLIEEYIELVGLQVALNMRLYLGTRI